LKLNATGKRTYLWSLLLVPLFTGARADEPPQIAIQAGEQRPMNTIPRWQPKCDDPSIAWISADGKAILNAVKPGTTLCSLANDGGSRFVWQIVVTQPK